MDIIETYKECMEKDDAVAAGEALGKAFSLSVNNLFYNAKKTAEDLFSDSGTRASFGKLGALWIQVLEYMYLHPFLYDGRNEYAVRTGHMLYGDPMVAGYISGRLTEKDTAFMEAAICTGRVRAAKGETIPMEVSLALHMAMDHRTLQQTFSGIVFHFLKMDIPGLDDNKKGDWEKCPLV